MDDGAEGLPAKLARPSARKTKQRLSNLKKGHFGPHRLQPHAPGYGSTGFKPSVVWMRDFRGMKRQRGRNRKPGGGGGNQNNPNRAFESNGPEGAKVRGNAQHVYERYQQLARDAFSSGDRVLAENYLQHAEHYFRLLRTIQPTRPVTEIVARDAFASGYDIDFEDEHGNPIEYDGTATAQGDTEGGDQQQSNGNGGQPREDRQRDDRPRDDRPREDRGEFRRDREFRDNREFRNDRPRDDRPRDDRARDDRPREDREPRAEGQAGEGEGRRRESRRERFERRRERNRDEGGERAADPLAVVEPRGADLPAREASEPPKPRFRDQDESHMPAFLGRAAPVAAAPEAAEPAADKPKRAPRKKKVADEAPADAD